MIVDLPALKVVEMFNITPRILIVDDGIYNREVLKRIFMKNAEIREAENGKAALEWLTRENFDIVLLDVMMPGMTGLEVLKRIRDTPETADLPVILITALNENEDMVRGLQTGANDYITKPIDIDVVRARVDTQLSMKFITDVYKQSITELEAAQKMKNRLLSIASHDLKSPLANIGIAEYLLRGFVNDHPAALEILQTMRSTVSHMQNVIEEFLELTACQSGHINIALEAVPVNETILSVIAHHEITASEKGIKIELGELQGIALADCARLKQSLSNLVSNAIKYTPLNTTVTIWSDVTIWSESCIDTEANTVRIFIADQGPGIPAGECEKLFTEFGRLSTRPTADESSTGLGLWIVKHMVHLQNGTVGVECPPDGGSIFWIELPAV